jgi:hypothetical protein
VGQRVYRIAATGENAARFMRLLAVSAPSAGGEYLSEKFNKFVKEARVEVQLDKNSIRRTNKGPAAADLTISVAGVAEKYIVYLRNTVELRFVSPDRSRAELAALLLRHAGVTPKVKKVGDRDVWYVYATTHKLAAGRKELRDAIANIVREAAARGWVDAGKAEGWLEELGRGRVLKEGWPEYSIQLVKGALVVRFASTNPDNIEREVQRFREMGLEESRHFSVKMPEEGREGYVYILKKGLERVSWLSEHGSGRQRELAAEFVEYILQRAKKAGEDVYRKAEEIVKEGMSRSSLTLKGFEREVEVDGRIHVVKVIDGRAEFGRSKSGKMLLRIRITAEVDGVRSEFEITFGRYGRDNAALGRTYARADAPRRQRGRRREALSAD